MLRKITVLLFALSTLCATAQKLNVKGIVKDAASGEVLPGVSIVIKGSTTGTETDFDGQYSFTNVSKGATLVFRYLGYKTNEVIVNSATINVSLEATAETLDEIVVIGYGTQRKKEVTGAVSVISSESIEQLKPTRIEQALQGQVAGVNVTASSGSPGAASNIRIRGISTNGDNRPLILVDGNVIEDLSVVNPSDIESINVLKDATAGIYGVRGANGVILITTKSGKKATDYKSTLNYYVGFQQTTKEISLLNATEYALLANEAFAANGEALPFPNVNGLGQGTNWQKAVFDTAPIYSLDYTLNKGTDKSTYSLGISVLDQDGIVGGDK
ncbi:MAG: TonB-dependent receptor plug domain-containing protein, partial [Polaribacter sp.]